ncbi:DUF3500 domain-containing protein [Mangrovicoccus algicola]|uniref:DUF3500 domain-containing protein n=1 Tax=Mangrovicoccus algicola TaxID=2771008 RepID=A0A8J6Z6A6_9RHOB|nr:DUF3500 domain-containing protein [Mangrovicoccus algicola]MBE3637205.1 DUF3500 domain-containing protein [Mangrovicoccus algicola]
MRDPGSRLACGGNGKDGADVELGPLLRRSISLTSDSDPVAPSRMIRERRKCTAPQLAVLLQELIGEDGFRNIQGQLRSDDEVVAEASQRARKPMIGADCSFVSFLGEPAADAPWMMQFGGHHLAINATVFGPGISFAPMLTGGEPLAITFEGDPIFITGAALAAAQALIDSLNGKQKAQAVRSGRRIVPALGPGQDGATPAREGIRATQLSEEQRGLLTGRIAQRVGLFKADDAAAKMAQVRAGLEETRFGWWGPGISPAPPTAGSPHRIW